MKTKTIFLVLLTFLFSSSYFWISYVKYNSDQRQNEISKLIKNNENDLNKVITLIKNDKVLNKNKGICINVSNLDYATKTQLRNILKDAKFVFLNGSYGEVEVIFKGWHLIHNPRFSHVFKTKHKSYPYSEDFGQSKVWFFSSKWQLAEEKTKVFGFWL